jgi:glutamine synthetase
MRPIRNGSMAAGIPVENSKGEAEAGQEELNIRYADALLAADHHTLAKQAVKEIAWATAARQPSCPSGTHDKVGSSAHVTSRCGRKDLPSTTPRTSSRHVRAMRLLHGGPDEVRPTYTFSWRPM